MVPARRPDAAMDLPTFLAFTLVYTVTVLVPGPGVAAIVARALGGGFAGAVPMIVGILVGDLVYLAFAAFGLATIATYFAPLFLVIRFAGAAYLLWIAYKFWTARPGSEQMAPRSESRWKTFLAGLSLTLGNPKTIVFYLALLPTVVPLDRMTPLVFLELVVIVTTVLLPIGALYAWLAARARDFFKSQVAMRRLNRGAAVIMAAAAGTVAIRG